MSNSTSREGHGLLFSQMEGTLETANIPRLPEAGSVGKKGAERGETSAPGIVYWRRKNRQSHERAAQSVHSEEHSRTRRKHSRIFRRSKNHFLDPAMPIPFVFVRRAFTEFSDRNLYRTDCPFSVLGFG
jgi:hypothetical protein